MRYVMVTLAKLKTTETYTVMYGCLPLYYFSCGLLGHSLVLCPAPAERDVNGDLPYAAKKLCAITEQPWKSSGAKSGATCELHWDFPKKEERCSIVETSISLGENQDLSD